MALPAIRTATSFVRRLREVTASCQAVRLSAVARLNWVGMITPGHPLRTINAIAPNQGMLVI
jgi:hypothetical protein